MNGAFYFDSAPHIVHYSMRKFVECSVQYLYMYLSGVLLVYDNEMWAVSTLTAPHQFCQSFQRRDESSFAAV